MGAVPASGPSYMEHCVSWHLPALGADLILVEYAVNFDSVSDDAQSFERLIRRLLRLPNHPAIVARRPWTRARVGAAAARPAAGAS